MVDGSSDFRVRGNVISGFHGSDALGEIELEFFRAQ